MTTTPRTAPAPMDANALEALARKKPDELFLKGSGVLKLLDAIRKLEAEVKRLKQGQPPAQPHLVARAPSGKTPQSVRDVLINTVGGLGKRLSESEEIATVLLRHGPDMFRHAPSLAYNLHANDQFLLALFAAAGDSDSLPSDVRRRIQAMLDANRSLIFMQIYASAGLPPPPAVTERVN